MTLHTAMPLELVLDGWSASPGPLLDVVVDGVLMQVTPTGPGRGKIVRLYHAPLELYLRPEYAPGAEVAIGGAEPGLSAREAGSAAATPALAPAGPTSGHLPSS